MIKKDYLSTPKGTRDILLEECEAQGRIEDRLKASFQSYGYRPVITPGIEYLDVFAEAPGNTGSEHMFKLVDNEGRILVLRPDSTAPIARLTATRLKHSEKPLRLYYNQRIYRQKNLYSGHNIETSQMGVELIGANTIRADLEVLQLATEALESCGLRDYRIELGHGGLCELLISRLTPDERVKEQLRQLIQAKNYPTLSDFLDTMGQGEAVRVIKALPGLFGGGEVFRQAAGLFHDQETKDIIEYMHALFEMLPRFGLGEKVMLDLGFVNANDYYTGIIFQVYLQGSGEAVLVGGRYDRLLERFGEKLPAVGFGVNVDLLTKNRLDQGSEEPSEAPGLLVWGEPGYEIDGMKYAQSLRESRGGAVENGLFENLDQCKAYALSKRISSIHTVGEAVRIYGPDAEKGGGPG
ncbi:MAG: ATP phosphoribosyltransferase regulatory subunit [Clostridiales bacterium]|nr:ATP phosphoribosyltransferase regulatory subunit [Clostridiales bacterium]